MNRRGFVGFSLAAVGGVFMGRRWYQQGRGLIVPESAGGKCWEYSHVEVLADGGHRVVRYTIKADEMERLQVGDWVRMDTGGYTGSVIRLSHGWPEIKIAQRYSSWVSSYQIRELTPNLM